MLSRRPLTGYIFLVALILRVAFIFYSHQYEILVEHTEATTIAQSLALHGFYGNPFKAPTGPTAHIAPGYPVLLSLVYRVFHVTPVAEWIKEGMNTGVSSLVAALLPTAAIALGLPVLAGNIGGFAAAILPFYFYNETKGEWEAMYTALTLLLAVIFMARAWKKQQAGMQETIGQSALRGLLWGLGMSFSPVLLAVMLSYSAFESWMAIRRHSWLSLRSVGVLLVVAASIQIPWTVRNWNTFHAFIWSRDNFGQEFFWGNHEGVYADFEDNLAKGDYRILHPNETVEASQYMARIGEIQFNREKLELARTWIGSHPKTFVLLSLHRAWLYWFTPARVPSIHMLLWLVSAAAFVGLWRMRQPYPLAFTLLAILWIVYPLPYYITMAVTRHTIPMLWTQFLAAGVSFTPFRFMPPNRAIIEK